LNLQEITVFDDSDNEALYTRALNAYALTDFSSDQVIACKDLSSSDFRIMSNKLYLNDNLSNLASVTVLGNALRYLDGEPLSTLNNQVIARDDFSSNFTLRNAKIDLADNISISGIISAPKLRLLSNQYFTDISLEENNGYVQLKINIDDGGDTVVIEDHKLIVSGDLELNGEYVNSWAHDDNYTIWNDSMLIPAGVAKRIIDPLQVQVNTLQTQLDVLKLKIQGLGGFAAINEPGNENIANYITYQLTQNRMMDTAAHVQLKLPYVVNDCRKIEYRFRFYDENNVEKVTDVFYSSGWVSTPGDTEAVGITINGYNIDFDVGLGMYWLEELTTVEILCAGVEFAKIKNIEARLAALESGIVTPPAA
jgi:hypothetical protein